MPQGTIKTYDMQTKSGVLLDDARTELAFDRESFEGTGIRMFRIGQRVKYETETFGSRTRVRNLTIVTL